MLSWKSILVQIYQVMQLTLLISLAPNHAVSWPYGGGMTLTPLDKDGESSPCSSFSSRPEKTTKCTPYSCQFSFNQLGQKYLIHQFYPFHMKSNYTYLPIRVNMSCLLIVWWSWTKHYRLLILQHHNGPYRALQPDANPLLACTKSDKKNWNWSIPDQLY